MYIFWQKWYNYSKIWKVQREDTQASKEFTSNLTSPPTNSVAQENSLHTITRKLPVKCRLINRVLETRFSGGRHMKKMPYKTWSDHGNWVFETRFIGLNRVFETREISNIYSLKTVLTNYIVWRTVLISNFSCYLA